MQESDFPQFKNIMAGLAENYQRELSQPLLDTYWLALRDWTYSDFAAASAQLLLTSEFMPRPSAYHKARKATEATAGEVFGQLKQWFTYSPNGYTMKADTPRRIAASVRAIGGPDSYMLCDVSKLTFIEKRFCEHYDQIGEVMATREALPQLTGNHVHGYLTNGHDET